MQFSWSHLIGLSARIQTDHVQLQLAREPLSDYSRSSLSGRIAIQHKNGSSKVLLQQAR
jgi:hypothetical protein